MKTNKIVISIVIAVLAVLLIIIGAATIKLGISNHQLQSEFDRLITRGEYYSPTEAQISELKKEFDAQSKYSTPEDWFDKWCNEAIDTEMMSLAYEQDYESHRYVKRITAIEEDYENGEIDVWTAIYAVRETRGEAVELADVSWIEK